ncbi:RNA polymerase, sigma subunit, ECF family [Tistlia consotensis]|uniref:RNA polymerase, sigma subunit, ECF family n=1 Tax=Tistlia consotensis USBA 355 TaxID=560819 RepID=A0A1Y6BAN7_9PROT|nr:RNA polymerase sigma factor SigJ [Tistlia consotensis]SMF01808.1 RNA polymerase, sigma subunit, ECF family [Tistlia consotensis USBA 355]SNS37628.1 RNA polymerase, sigma subunit, ECF family [Tistlia consotensis]
MGDRDGRREQRRDAATAAFEQARPRLWSLAYRMLGSVADAEDAVQTTWLKWRGADSAAVEQPEAWLVTTCTRTCLDLRRAADRSRVDYVGLWLPEPVPDDPLLGTPARNPAEQAELASSLTLAFLHLLERLTPAERAAYLLREIFDYDYERVAAILGKREPACRQLVARARRALAAAPESAAPAARGGALLDSFLAALSSGDAGRLEGLLAADVELLSDGGGKASVASKVVRGPRAVARFLAGIWRLHYRAQQVEPVPLNGGKGLLIREAGLVTGTLSLSADAEGRCLRIYIQRNPDKLRHLQDLPAATRH